ncbi:MAG: hypothetical protein JKY37_23985 [Nannocystaceae bacterium]|nr:hypothetical protein [Nannocystaceae bacterium]
MDERSVLLDVRSWARGACRCQAAAIEVVVHDVEATAAVLRDLGHPRVDYHDKERHYYQVPGGQVFRLAQQS